MKKRIIAAVLFLVIGITASASGSIYELIQVDYPIYANGELVEQGDLPTLSYHDNTYVPLRKVSEATGASVYWDNDTETIWIDNTKLDLAKQLAFVSSTYNRMVTLTETVIHADENLQNAITYINSNMSYFQISLAIAKDYFEKYIPSDVAIINQSLDTLREMQTDDVVSMLGYNPYDKISENMEILNSNIAALQEFYNLFNGYLNGIYTNEYAATTYINQRNEPMISIRNISSFCESDSKLCLTKIMELQ